MCNKEYINKETVSLFCNTNESLLAQSARGIVLEFPGLGGDSCLGGKMSREAYVDAYASDLAKEGLILAYIFPGPWSWMNRGSVVISDLVVDALRDKHNLKEDSPLVAIGGSMGGLGALIYTASSKHKVSACVAHCPCCDVTKFYNTHPDFPRTFISAIASYDIPFYTGLQEISPRHRIMDMPSVPYLIISDEKDEVFDSGDIQEYAQQLQDVVTSKVIYHCLPDLTHGQLTPQMYWDIKNFIIEKSKIN